MSESGLESTVENLFQNWLQRLDTGRSFFGALLSLLGFAETKTTGATYSPTKEVEYDGTPLGMAKQALRDIQNGKPVVDYTGSEVKGPAYATFDADVGTSVIHKWLKVAGVDASALDPEGKKSAEEMEAVIRDASKNGYISRAREYMAEMTAGGTHGRLYFVAFDGAAQDSKFHDGLLLDPHDMAKAVQTEIDRANKIAIAIGQQPVDLSALDPAGKKTAAKMQTALHETIKENYVLQARRVFECLVRSHADLNGLQLSDDYWQEAHKYLDLANKAASEYGLKAVDASALSSQTGKSPVEIEKMMLKMNEDIEIKSAQECMDGGHTEDAKGWLAKANRFAGMLGENRIDVEASIAILGKSVSGDIDENVRLKLGKNRFSPDEVVRETSAISEGSIVSPLTTPTAILSDRSSSRDK